MSSVNNVGNVVGLIKSTTPPLKKYVVWAHQFDPLDLDKVELKEFDFDIGDWVLLRKMREPEETKTLNINADIVLDDNHRNVVIYIRGNNKTVEVPAAIVENFGCSFRSIGQGNKIKVPTSLPVIGDIDQLGTTVGGFVYYEILENGSVVLVKNSIDLDLTGNFV